MHVKSRRQTQVSILNPCLLPCFRQSPLVTTAYTREAGPQASRWISVLTSRWPPVDLHFTVGPWGYRPVLCAQIYMGSGNSNSETHSCMASYLLCILAHGTTSPRRRRITRLPQTEAILGSRKKQKQKHKFASRNQRKHGRAAEWGCWDF